MHTTCTRKSEFEYRTRKFILSVTIHEINYNPLCLLSETTENDFRTTYLTRLVFCFIEANILLLSRKYALESLRRDLHNERQRKTKIQTLRAESRQHLSNNCFPSTSSTTNIIFAEQRQFSNDSNSTFSLASLHLARVS